MTSGIWVVYWLYNDRCVCYWRHGYIGVSGRFNYRLSQHRRGHGQYAVALPSNFQWKILFTGTREECFAVEEHFRPLPLIGWNIARGGASGRGRMAVTSKQKIRIKIIERGGIDNPVPKGTIRSAADRLNISAGTKAAGSLTAEQRQRQITNTQRGPSHHAYGKPMKITNPSLGKNQAGTSNPFFGKRHSLVSVQQMIRTKVSMLALLLPKPANSTSIFRNCF